MYHEICEQIYHLTKLKHFLSPLLVFVVSLKVVDLEAKRIAKAKREGLSPLVLHNRSFLSCEPLLSIPNVSFSLNITQTSSISRYIFCSA